MRLSAIAARMMGGLMNSVADATTGGSNIVGDGSPAGNAPELNQSASRSLEGVEWSDVNGASGVKVRMKPYNHQHHSSGAFADLYLNGMSIQIKYNGDTKEFSDFVWIQSYVEVDNGKPGKSQRDGSSDTYPFIGHNRRRSLDHKDTMQRRFLMTGQEGMRVNRITHLTQS